MKKGACSKGAADGITSSARLFQVELGVQDCRNSVWSAEYGPSSFCTIKKKNTCSAEDNRFTRRRQACRGLYLYPSQPKHLAFPAPFSLPRETPNGSTFFQGLIKPQISQAVAPCRECCPSTSCRAVLFEMELINSSPEGEGGMSMKRDDGHNQCWASGAAGATQQHKGLLLLVERLKHHSGADWLQAAHPPPSGGLTCRNHNQKFRTDRWDLDRLTKDAPQASRDGRRLSARKWKTIVPLFFVQM